jgi:putative DNA primase/helicase
MEGWEPPAGVRVIVFGDNDRNYAGHAAAYTLAKKLSAKRVEVEVCMAPTPGTDWNDAWRAREIHTERAA